MRGLIHQHADRRRSVFGAAIVLLRDRGPAVLDSKPVLQVFLELQFAEQRAPPAYKYPLIHRGQPMTPRQHIIILGLAARKALVNLKRVAIASHHAHALGLAA